MGVNSVTVKSEVDVKALLFALTHAPDAHVGYPRETTGSVKHEEANVPLATLASWHEFGDEGRPARPFMRQGAANLVKRRGLLVPHVRRLVSGRIHAMKFMAVVGTMLKRSIESEIKEQDFAPLSPATIAAKGSSEILVDTGELVDGLDVHLT